MAQKERPCTVHSLKNVIMTLHLLTLTLVSEIPIYAFMQACSPLRPRLQTSRDRTYIRAHPTLPQNHLNSRANQFLLLFVNFKLTKKNLW